MKALSRFTFMVGLFVTALGLQGGVVQARTPTPTAILAPTATATPPPFAAFFGYAWVDGQLSSGPVVAKIGSQTCGTATILPASEVGFSYRIEIASNEAVAGCGRAGAPITFFVAGQQAAQTGLWQAGSGTFLNLVAGAPFAVFVGTLPIDPDVDSTNLQAFAGEAACRQYFSTAQGGYEINVLSTPGTGCGTEGAVITFKLLDPQGNVVAVAQQTGVWHAWDGDQSSYEQLALTFTPVTPVRVGSTGGGPGGGASPWLRLSVGLALLGLASGIGAFALRRRAAK